MNKNKYLQALQTAKDIVKKDIPSSTNLITTAEELTDKVQDFKIKVLVIGEFSSGKTALMNRLLGINLLKEDVTPETAIATELVYDEKEGVDLVLSSGEAEHCSLADVPTPDPDTYLKYNAQCWKNVLHFPFSPLRNVLHTVPHDYRLSHRSPTLDYSETILPLPPSNDFP